MSDKALVLPAPDIRVTAFGEVVPTDKRPFVMGDFYSAQQMQAAILAEREACAAMAQTWGDARKPLHGGHACRNLAIAIRNRD